MIARSLAASCFWAPLGAAAYSHDNHLLASSALKKCACVKISRATIKSHGHHRADDGNVNTGGTVGRDGERGVALLPRVRDGNGDARPTSAVALATTQHTTRREVTSGGRRRARRWADGGQADMHAHAPCSSMREVGSKTIGGVSTAVRLLSATLAGGK